MRRHPLVHAVVTLAVLVVFWPFAFFVVIASVASWQGRND